MISVYTVISMLLIPGEVSLDPVQLLKRNFLNACFYDSPLIEERSSRSKRGGVRVTHRFPVVCLGDQGVVLQSGMGISMLGPWNRNSHKLDKQEEVCLKRCDNFQIPEFLVISERYKRAQTAVELLPLIGQKVSLVQ